MFSGKGILDNLGSKTANVVNGVIYMVIVTKEIKGKECYSHGCKYNGEIRQIL